MKKETIMQSSILTVLLATISIHLHAESLLYNVHAINATIEMLDGQSKEHNNYQELEQLCGSLKQQNQRQTMQLEDTRTELTLMQARLEKQAEENSALKNTLASANTEKEILEMAQANLNQELLCAHQKIEKYAATSQEYNQLKQQMAQAQTDLQFPDAQKIDTLMQASIPGQQMFDGNKNS